MKSKMFILAMTCLFSFCFLNAQETPKPPPPPPSAPPAPPAPPVAMPNPPIAPEAPTPPNKPDTTKIVIGDKQIMIIDNNEKKEGKEKASWEQDLERSMKEMKEDLEEAKQDLEESKIEMEESKKEMKESQKEMEQDLKNEQEENNENQAPGEKHKLTLKLKKGMSRHKAVDVDFLDFDFGVNLLNVGSSIPKQMENDLKLKTWGSWTYTFTFLPTKIFLGTRHLYLMTGLGWRIGQFEFKEKIDFDPVKPLTYTKDDNLEKSQFVIHQLQIPLSIYWKSKRIKNWGDVGFGVGTYAGILIHQELETETAHPKRDIETNEDFGFEKFRYGLSARLDIGPLKLFANMDMNKLWKDNDIKNIETGIWLDF